MKRTPNAVSTRSTRRQYEKPTAELFETISSCFIRRVTRGIFPIKLGFFSRRKGGERAAVNFRSRGASGCLHRGGELFPGSAEGESGNSTWTKLVTKVSPRSHRRHEGCYDRVRGCTRVPLYSNRSSVRFERKEGTKISRTRRKIRLVPICETHLVVLILAL